MHCAPWYCAGGLMLVLGGCIHRGQVDDSVPLDDPLPTTQTKVRFDEALAGFTEHDRRADWEDSTCRSVASQFESLGRRGATEHRATSWYNAGLAYQRCRLHERARDCFEQAQQVAADSDVSVQSRAEAQLVLYDYEGDHNRERAIRRLEQVVRAGRFQNVEALTSLATLELEQGIAAGGQGTIDLAHARENLQRALAIDETYMPALNELALLLLASARTEKGVVSAPPTVVLAGVEAPRLSRQQLDLAALVASQGLRKNPRFAPLHNTAGLIQVQQRDYNAAVRSFAKARELDPGFVEAHLNYAAVNLTIRGFSAAEDAYRDALRLRPESYEAQLGLALALRGQLSLDSPDQRIGEVLEHLASARKLDPQRPESYYNEAILTQDVLARRELGPNAVALLERAYCLYGSFAARTTPGVHNEARQRAAERREELVDTLRFVSEQEDRSIDCDG